MRRACLVFTAILLLSGCATISASRQPPAPAQSRDGASATLTINVKADAPPLVRLIAAGLAQTEQTTGYDPAYTKLNYPGGDVPLATGVCADVIVRAFRLASLDLQKEVHEDMTRSFAAYPTTWEAKKPDSNIDHRRVGNLMKWFERQGKALPLTKDAKDYAPGDVVAWDLGNGRLHIGLVTDRHASGLLGQSENFLMVHNIGAGARIEDVLFAWPVIGHYRYFQSNNSDQNTAPARPPAGALKIGFVEDKSFQDGCGCSLQFPEDEKKNRERYVLLHNFENIALMNIDGQDIRLELIENRESAHQDSIRKGERSSELYQAGKLGVRVNYLVTKVCDPNDEACEVTWYDATITVTRDNQKKVLKTKGTCGC